MDGKSKKSYWYSLVTKHLAKGDYTIFYFHVEILTVNEKNVLSNKTAWDFSKDWPTRSHCMKFIVPIRGTGVHVEQNSIPVKIINHVESIAKVYKLILTNSRIHLNLKRLSIDNGGGK